MLSIHCASALDNVLAQVSMTFKGGPVMTRRRIVVINPNSNETVTHGLDEALRPLSFTGGPEIVCTTLAGGPYGIESQADVESIALPLLRFVESDNGADAFVIACYSDPACTCAERA